MYAIGGIATDITERKRAEAEQRRLAAVVESSADAIVSADRAGRFTSWNPGAERLYGYSAEEIIGRPISVLAPDDLQDEQAALVERTLRAESIPVVETRRRRRDGSLVDVSIRGSVVRDSSGAVIGTCAIHRDMTEPRRIREALRRSEELFRGGFEHSPIGMMMTSREGTFERVNDAFARMLGYEDRSELVGVHFTSITHPDDRAAGLEAVRMMFEQGVPFTTEKRYLRRDGSIVHVLLGSIAIEGSEGRSSVLFTQVEDITERKRAEEELRHERDFIDATLDVAGALILVLDRDWRIVRFNRQSELLSGYGEAEVLGRHYDFLIPEPEREAVQVELDQTAAASPDQPGEPLDHQGRPAPSDPLVKRSPGRRRRASDPLHRHRHRHHRAGPGRAGAGAAGDDRRCLTRRDHQPDGRGCDRFLESRRRAPVWIQRPGGDREARGDAACAGGAARAR